jgi:hypothetical protein
VVGSKRTKSKYETLIAGGASEKINLIDADSKRFEMINGLYATNRGRFQRTESAGLITCCDEPAETID